MVPGIAVRHHGYESHPENNGPTGCMFCGKVDVAMADIRGKSPKSPPLPE